MKRKNLDMASYEPKKKFKAHHKYLIAGAIITAGSFLLTLVPCSILTSKSMIPGVCKLPNPFINLTTTSHYYYGFSNNPITGLILQFIVSMLIVYGFIFLIKKLNLKRKNYKIVDLTKR
ncbi:hypothetical protein J4218_02510 [Candidatus Pacearchaeota archaeon]|nr:hypothetical protein [Candidatus Pacearchaeota archaeon]